ncbi:UDP-2,4-diacetamido-2,4,6-trideoxy-beta-L-altropyranose hydrolase [Herbaspirillum robiniae]|nr:UDP-2,4-diacetamido-2,4,6-trideoxy-beta-L-altropyranose hydrolase [Herbaspirillum robiniae]
MNVVFRADASLQIGTGHIVRSLSLADKLRARGLTPHFVCRMHAGNMVAAIRQQGYGVTELPTIPAFSPLAAETCDFRLAHADWLGSDWKQDADETRSAIQDSKPDLLIVDHYAIDKRWEEQLRPHVRKLMVIDDLADRRHECDFLLDQNWFGDDTLGRYRGMIPDHCITMLGPEYALLKPEYSMLRAQMPPRNGKAERILVFMGGSDPTNETGKVLDALAHPDLAHLHVDIVIGVNHPDPQSVTHQAAARPLTHVHSGLPSLAPLMMHADLMLSAGGSTSWERMCLGLPAIVISIADNQIVTNHAMHAAGYIHFLGECNQISATIIADSIIQCIQQPQQLQQMSQMGQDLVPGSGTQRVCDILLD